MQDSGAVHTFPTTTTEYTSIIVWSIVGMGWILKLVGFPLDRHSFLKLVPQGPDSTKQSTNPVQRRVNGVGLLFVKYSELLLVLLKEKRNLDKLAETSKNNTDSANVPVMKVLQESILNSLSTCALIV